MNLAEINIDQIVSNVLKEIQHRGGGSSADSAKVEETTTSINVIQITERVITADLLSNLTSRSSVVQLEPKAIITPAARDYIKEQGLQVSSKIESAGQSDPDKSNNQAVENWLALVVHSSESLESALASVSREKGVSWNQESVETTEKAALQAAQEIKSGNSTGVVIFCEKSATAACLVNRNEFIRGVAVRRPSESSDIEELDANVVCLPGRGLSFTEYRNILKSFISRSE